MSADVLAAIRGGMNGFSKGQKRIAAYILESFDKAAFMTASKLGRLVGVSESTVVRFAAMLGYDGYPAMQKALQDRYKHKWEPICPEIGQNKLLWMIGEIGEVIDIVKKNGGERASTDEELRHDLVEEMADVLMYYNDVMLCYGITAEELQNSYSAKFEKNMQRW